MSRLGLFVSSLSPKSSVFKPLLIPYRYKLIKKYSQHNADGKEDMVLSTDSERAPSTAEVMQQITEEKNENERILDEKSRQGFVSHTSDKMVDATKEAIGGESETDPEAVKDKYKETTPDETCHKPRNDGVSPTSM